MNTISWYLIAAVAEIAGCFSFWAWLRLAKPGWWTIPGIVSLIVFATALTRINAAAAGRAYAAYGGIYILSSVLWLWIVEKTRPDHWDVIGSAICLTGAAVIQWGPRSS